ncbi:MAG: peptidoglycan-binding domain-containing protein [Shimia sp.]
MRPIAPFLAVLALSACMGADTAPDVTRATPQDAPPGAAPGSCWDRDVSPAEFETVTEQVRVAKAEWDAEGNLLKPAEFRTTQRQRVVKDRTELWFETPCAAVLTPDFIRSVQRALAVRGYYLGPATGNMDFLTRRAIRRFQAEDGLDSATLSLAAARKLGLIAIDRDSL